MKKVTNVKHFRQIVLTLFLIAAAVFGASAVKNEVGIGRRIQSGLRAVRELGESDSESPDPEKTDFYIRFLDVGQADAALVGCGGHYMLIDGGNRDDSSMIYSVLEKSGISHLDMIVGTHAHEDHIGGLPGALNYASADLVLSPVTSYYSEVFRNFKKYADQNGNGLVVPSAGDEYKLGSADVKILGVNGGSDTNNTSIILKITYGETSFLFTGDAGREAEEAVLNSGADLSAAVLKVGHHGSDTSTTYPFLREIMPQYAVISVGAGNSYGHPAEDTLSRLNDAGAEIHRTDLEGEITVTSDGKNVLVVSGKNTSAISGDASEKTETPARTTQAAAEASESENSGTAEETEMDSCTYIFNTKTKKFHDPSCSSVMQMKEESRQIFKGMREEAIDMGYAPCGSCKP